MLSSAYPGHVNEFEVLESEIIEPVTVNCPNTDMLSTNMSNLHKSVLSFQNRY